MIELRNVTKVYVPGAPPAVSDITLTVPDGEICVFIGPSGCGKTTLMRMINRLIPVTQGEILWAAATSRRWTPSTPARHRLRLQQVGLFPLTVADNIAVVPRLLKWSPSQISARVEELLKLVNLEPAIFKDRYPRELSGGQAQRVGVARAMAADPPVMLMDEPFGAIDPINRETLQDEFLRIQERLKKTIIFVTHDINEAIKMGQRVALLRDGSLVQYGPPQELLTRPRNEFVKSFVGTDRVLKRLNLLKVKDALLPDPVHCHVDDPSPLVLEKMIDKELDFLLVTSGNRMLAGYVNQYDLRGHQGVVGDVVRELSLTVSPESNLKDALSKMLGYDLGMLVAVDEGGRVHGVLNSTTLVGLVGETYDERGGHWGKITAGGRILP